MLMSIKNKNPKTKGYRIIGLCAAAVVLGCVVPLIAVVDDTGTAKGTLLVMELSGAGVLGYVFMSYLLKR